ncbi:MAG: hypothetical protein V5B38_04645 [Candidatus Accumulibacter propinquus]|jgi:4-amino-4-deoxy-L-arabinose transferase-like glycosyltransferase
MLATLTAHTAAYWGLTQIDRRPLRGACWFGSALGLGFLANGLAPMLPLLPVAAFVVWRSQHRQRSALLLLGSLLLSCMLAGAWLAALFATSPDYLAAFWQGELTQLSGSVQPLLSLQRLLLMLPWYAWPALPLAGWTLWAKRRQLATTPLALPMFAFLVALLVVSVWLGARSAPALLLLPPLVLLAVPGVTSLRRGAANAFDWFGMITFSFFAALTWIAWCAMVFGWPEKARQAGCPPGARFRWSLQCIRCRPCPAGDAGLVLDDCHQSPLTDARYHALDGGLTLFWLLIATLWMPWIDYGKTYRQVSAPCPGHFPKDANASPVPTSPILFSPLWTISTISARCRQNRLPARGVTAAGAWLGQRRRLGGWRLAPNLGGWSSSRAP